MTKGMLSSATLSRAECASHWGGRETDGADKGRLGTLGHVRLSIESERGQLLLVTATESIGGRRGERDDILGRSRRLLGRRGAPGTPRAGIDLVGRGNLNGGSVHLGRGRGIAGSGWWRRVRQVGLDHLSSKVVASLLGLLEAGVQDILVLASELVECEIEASLGTLLGNLVVLELLTIRVHLRSKGGLLKLLSLMSVQVQASKLLSGEIEKLLLKLLLPLGKIDLGGEELGSNVGIQVGVVVLNRGRSEDLLGSIVHHVLLSVDVADGAAKTGTDSSLRNALVHGVGVVRLPGKAALVRTEIVLVLAVRGGGRRLSRSGSLGSGAQTGKEMRAAGARSLYLSILGDGGDLGGSSQTQALQAGALAARGIASGGEADAVGLEIVESHLSKTASGCHCVMVFKSKAAGKWIREWKMWMRVVAWSNARRDGRSVMYTRAIRELSGVVCDEKKKA